VGGDVGAGSTGGGAKGGGDAEEGGDGGAIATIGGVAATHAPVLREGGFAIRPEKKKKRGFRRVRDRGQGGRDRGRSNSGGDRVGDAFDVGVSADDRAMVALKAAFRLLWLYGDDMREGWRNMVECLLCLNAAPLRVLPAELVDSIAPAGQAAKDKLKTAAQRKSRGAGGGKTAKDKKKGGGFFAGLSSMLFSDGPEEDPIDEGKIERYRAVMAECEVMELCNRPSHFAQESLSDFIKAVILARDPRPMGVSRRGPASNATGDVMQMQFEQDVLLCIQLMTRLVAQQPHRATVTWPLVRVFFERIMSLQGYGQGGQVIELDLLRLNHYIVHSVLVIIRELLPYHPTILQSVDMFGPMPMGMKARMAPLIVRGLKSVIETNVPGGHLAGRDQWITMYQTMAAWAAWPGAGEVVLQILAYLVVSGKVGLHDYDLVLRLVLFFIDQVPGGTGGLRARSVERRLVRSELNDVGLEPGVGAGAAPAVPDAVRTDLGVKAVTLLHSLAVSCCHKEFAATCAVSMSAAINARAAAMGGGKAGDVGDIGATQMPQVPVAAATTDGGAAAGGAMGGVAGAAASAQANDTTLQDGCWLEIMVIFRELFCDRRPYVQRAARQWFQHSLVAADPRAPSEAAWALCFERILFPLAKETSTSDYSHDDHLAASNMVSRVFLHNVSRGRGRAGGGRG
jgi:hypothetical protein